MASKANYGVRPIDRDKLSMVPRSKVAHSALMALHQLQDIESPEEMVLGVSVLFAAFCHKLQLDASEVHAMGLKVLGSKDEGDVATGGALEVLRDFAEIRLQGREGTLGV